MKAKNIILTGFMGTGKTTIGILLAEKLGYDFVDTDHLIEKKCGMSIPDIFREKGENEFRDLETAISLELSGKENLIISTGGRLMLDAINAEALGKSGTAFCLTATVEEILNRVSLDQHSKRPLLEGTNPKKRITQLFQERREGYAKFTQITTSDKTPNEIVENILSLL